MRRHWCDSENLNKINICKKIKALNVEVCPKSFSSIDIGVLSLLYVEDLSKNDINLTMRFVSLTG